MGERRPRNQLLYGKLPRNVGGELSAVHIAKIWELLKEKFCFNTKVWKEDFKKYFQQQPHSVGEVEAFVEFGEKNINPVLNTVLRRNQYHPTWTNILKYVVGKY